MHALALSVDGLRVAFDGTPAVDGVSLSVGEGEVLAVLGPSGSGKSTLLRAIAGLELLDAGSVTWRGDDITTVAVHRRGFALMFQDGQLFPHRSVAQNVAYPLRIVGSAAQPGRVAELLALVGLDGFGDRRVTDLSGGEQQRVALARSLAANPRLLLLDEPLSALDRELRERLAGDLRRILVETRTTAIFVTHDQDEAFAVADRVAVMMAARLQQVGTPTDVWRRPASAAVARFLGYTTVLDAQRAALVDPSATGSVALRPSAVIVQEGAAVDGGGLGGDLQGGRHGGVVLASTPAIDGARLRLHLDGIGEVDAIAGPQHPPAVGDRVGVRFDPSAIAVLP